MARSPCIRAGTYKPGPRNPLAIAGKRIHILVHRSAGTIAGGAVAIEKQANREEEPCVKSSHSKHTTGNPPACASIDIMYKTLIIIAIILVLAIIGMLFIMSVISEVISGKNKRNGHNNGTADQA